MRVGSVVFSVAALMLAIAFSSTAVADAANRCRNDAVAPAPASKKAISLAVLCRLNKVRRQHDLRRLKSNGKQGRAAARHNRLMVKRNCFAHLCPGIAVHTGTPAGHSRGATYTTDFGYRR